MSPKTKATLTILCFPVSWALLTPALGPGDAFLSVLIVSLATMTTTFCWYVLTDFFEPDDR